MIGILKGEHFGNLTDRIVGVAAHYDTVSTTAGTLFLNSELVHCYHLDGFISSIRGL